jgi:cation diffusion facilitator CzcD-associated flavoprotein CzcO
MDPVRAKVLRASWSSEDQYWTVTTQQEGSHDTCTLTCKFLIPCTGYYNYDHGHRPDFAGLERFGASASIRNTGLKTWTIGASASS